MRYSYELRICIDEDILNEKQSEYYDKFTNSNYKIRCDSGVDIICPQNVDFDSGTQLVDLGIKCAMYRITNTYTTTGALVKKIFEPSPYYLYPRSSIYKTSYRQANSVGIIDCGYRGNLKAAMDYYPHKEHVSLIKGNRYWQICSPDLTPINNILVVDELDKTIRGIGGHGSTGD